MTFSVFLKAMEVSWQSPGSPWVLAKLTAPQSWRGPMLLREKTDLDFGMRVCFLTRWVRHNSTVCQCFLPISAFSFLILLQPYSKPTVCPFFIKLIKSVPLGLVVYVLSVWLSNSFQHPPLTLARLGSFHHGPQFLLLCWRKYDSPRKPHSIRCCQEDFSLGTTALTNLLWTATEFLVYPT